MRQVEGVGAVVGCATAGLRLPAGPTCCVAVHAPVAPGVPVAALRCLRCLPACPDCCLLLVPPLFLSCREIDPDSLEIMEKLGEGEFGVVHKAKW